MVKKRKNTIPTTYVEMIDRGSLFLREYILLQESAYDVKLEKTFSKMTDDEKRLMIERVSAMQ